MKNKAMNRILATILVINTALIGFPVSSVAAPISTQTMLQLEQREARIDRIEAALRQDQVQQAFVEMGVAPAEAQQRVAALTDSELATLEQQLDQLPAGGDLLAVVGIVFVVLIILDLVGVTDVFSGIDKVTR
ncbi:MAG: PA2779 family protein [Thiogranum sp.]|nr:PA2779 family protein [Thiogranum sp.]